MKRPKKGEFAAFYEGYLSQVPPRGTVQILLKRTLKETLKLLGSLPEDMGDHAYEPGKWTIKQLLIHMIDAERVFAFRALLHNPAQSGQLLPVKVNSKLRVKSGHFSGAN